MIASINAIVIMDINIQNNKGLTSHKLNKRYKLKNPPPKSISPKRVYSTQHSKNVAILNLVFILFYSISSI